MAKTKSKALDKFGDAALKVRQSQAAASFTKSRSDSVAKSAVALLGAKQKMKNGSSPEEPCDDVM